MNTSSNSEKCPAVVLRCAGAPTGPEGRVAATLYVRCGTGRETAIELAALAGRAALTAARGTAGAYRRVYREREVFEALAAALREPRFPQFDRIADRAEREFTYAGALEAAVGEVEYLSLRARTIGVPGGGERVFVRPDGTGLFDPGFGDFREIERDAVPSYVRRVLGGIDGDRASNWVLGIPPSPVTADETELRRRYGSRGA